MPLDAPVTSARGRFCVVSVMRVLYPAERPDNLRGAPNSTGLAPRWATVVLGGGTARLDRLPPLRIYPTPRAAVSFHRRGLAGVHAAPVQCCAIDVPGTVVLLEPAVMVCLHRQRIRSRHGRPDRP